MHSKLYLLMAIAVSQASAESSIEFRGIFEVSPSSEFALFDKDSGVSRWAKIGDNFQGYKVASFDKGAGILTLHSPAEDIRLRLAEAFVKTAKALAAQIPKELAERGITIEDLIIRHSPEVTIYLAPGVQKEPTKRRFVEVSFETPKGSFEATWDSENRVPSEIASYVTTADVEAIDRHIALVRTKWLPE